MNVLKLGDKSEEVKTLQSILKAQGYFSGDPMGNFGEKTREAVFWFQATHLGPDGKFLDAECEVGDNTWWALNNPSGDPQVSNIDPIIPSGLSLERQKVLTIAVGEKKKGVCEVPDGSNWGPEIAKYGGQKGWAWCQLFVNYCFKQGLGRYPIGANNPGTYVTWKTAVKKGIWKDKKNSILMPGDAFIMQYRDAAGNYSGKGHTGLILRVSPDGKLFNAIEGNCANKVKCTLHEVSSSKIIGYVNPYGDVNYDFEKGVLYGNLSDDSYAGTR